MPSRRRVGQAVLLAAAAAVGTCVAIRSRRRTPRTHGEPATVVAAPEEHQGPPVPAGAPVRRNWAGLIAVPAVAIVVLSCAQAVTWTTPYHRFPEYQITPEPGIDSQFRPNAYDLGDLVRAAASPPSHTPFPDVSAQRRCTVPEGPAPTYRIPPPSEASVTSRDALSAPPCQTLVLGATATIVGPPGELTQVTASLAAGSHGQPTTRRLPNGRQRVSIRLHVRYLGSSDEQLPYIWVFAATPESGWMFPVDSSDDTVWLKPGEEADQFVEFDVNRNVRLARLRLGLNPDAVDWVFG